MLLRTSGFRSGKRDSGGLRGLQTVDGEIRVPASDLAALRIYKNSIEAFCKLSCCN
jgi:hypothetical protein